jgi:hypothetical protein
MLWSARKGSSGVAMARGFRVSEGAGERGARPFYLRLGFLIVVGLLVGGGLAVRTFQERVRHERAIAALSEDLDTVGRFNELEAALASGLAEAGEDLAAGVAVLLERAPELAAHAEVFGAMAERGLPEGLDFEPPEREALAASYGELVRRYAEEAALYGRLAEAAALEPPGAAWLEILPVLDELDRILGSAAESRQRLQERLDALDRDKR